MTSPPITLKEIAAPDAPDSGYLKIYADADGDVSTLDSSDNEVKIPNISNATLKATPVGADIVLIEDSEASYVKKRATITSLQSSAYVSDIAYAASWDGVTTIAPSKNSVYDIIQEYAVDTEASALTVDEIPVVGSYTENQTSDDNLQLLLHLNNNYNDKGIVGHTVTATNTPVFSNADSEILGSHCLELESTSSQYLTVPYHIDMILNQKKFYLGGRFKFESIATTQVIYSRGVPGALSSEFYWDPSTKLTFRYSTNDTYTSWTDTLTVSWTPSTSKWYWIAVAADAVGDTTEDIYFIVYNITDGTSEILQGMGLTARENFGATSEDLIIGASNQSGSTASYFDGYMDELVYYVNGHPSWFTPGATPTHITPTTQLNITTAYTVSSSISVDTISESTNATGVTVDGVLLKDSIVNVDTIAEKTSDTGVTVDGVLHKDSSTTAQTLKAEHTAPTITIHNTTDEDGDGGREGQIIFRGDKDSDGSESTLGLIEFSHDGTGDDQKGKWAIKVNDGNDGDTPSITAIQGGSNGNVGIGTDSPAARAHVAKNQNAATYLHISNTTSGTDALVGLTVGEENEISTKFGMFGHLNTSYSGVAAFPASSVAVYSADVGGLSIVAGNATGEICFFTGGVGADKERMTISSAGNVTVNTGTLSITNSASITDLRTNASGTLYDGASDSRLKTKIMDYDKGLAEVLQLNPVKYKWKKESPLNDGEVEHIGFIADEVEKVLPKAVGRKSQLGLDDCKTFSEKSLVPALVNAIKEQQAQIEELKTRINKIEGKK